jgi:3-hydroxyethyl bacteriochlorophyllide a dehydrogenase
MNLRDVALASPADGDCVIDIEWSGISTGTERLLWQGRMPPFPGLSYPLVPGYESVGRITVAAQGSPLRAGQRVFVPGSRGYADVAGLFGGASSRLVAPSDRLVAIGDELGEEATLLALAATAFHAIHCNGHSLPDLVVGHGVLGRLIARLVVALGGNDVVVWESNASRQTGATDYRVTDPADDDRGNYTLICDVSGDSGILDVLISRLAPGGEIILAGFYDKPLSFDFPPAFMREAAIRIAAEWQPEDLGAVLELVQRGTLSLAGLITHRATPEAAADAYETAFESADCLKMILDWRAA